MCAWYTGHTIVSPLSLFTQLFEDCTLVQRLTGPFWMKVIVTVVEDSGTSTPPILFNSVEQTCVLISRKWDLFRWRPFYGICFFCLDVSCRRRVVLRYRVSGGGEWKCGCLSYSCQGLFCLGGNVLWTEFLLSYSDNGWGVFLILGDKWLLFCTYMSWALSFHHLP